MIDKDMRCGGLNGKVGMAVALGSSVKNKLGPVANQCCR
jgi:hypothetical protein